MPGKDLVHVSTHPLVAHKITLLSDVGTGIVQFRLLVAELTQLILYEATQQLPTIPVPYQSPLEQATGSGVAARIGLVPILRAGLGMVDRAADLMPFATVYHIGIYRDEQTHLPVSYYNRLPDDLSDQRLIMLDPMLATAGSASATASFLKARGATSIVFVGLIAAPEGVAHMAEVHPDVPIFVARLDRQLDENKYIRPGLGDAGDRLFGTAP
ncbi:MAG TPA: uracil phosphoribosyltransferase [Thermomicrobiales bacterium]|nr:uracil phosphoribosyltransferase [Thermomicrobiales bacterium]